MERPRAWQPDHDTAVDWRAADEASLVEGMRRGVEAATAEFLSRFTLMIHGMTRRLRLSASERRRLVDDFLGRAAMRFGRAGVRTPRSLTPYLATSFRHYLATAARTENRRHGLHEGLMTDVGQSSERAVAEVCSAYLLRIAGGREHPEDEVDADDHGDRDRRAKLREELARSLITSLTDEEQRILAWRSERLPYREIAKMLGITIGAARVRVMRLRDRLFAAATRHIAALPAADGILLAEIVGTPRRQRGGVAARASPLGGRIPGQVQVGQGSSSPATATRSVQ